MSHRHRHRPLGTLFLDNVGRWVLTPVAAGPGCPTRALIASGRAGPGKNRELDRPGGCPLGRPPPWGCSTLRVHHRLNLILLSRPSSRWCSAVVALARHPPRTSAPASAARLYRRSRSTSTGPGTDQRLTSNALIRTFLCRVPASVGSAAHRRGFIRLVRIRPLVWSRLGPGDSASCRSRPRVSQWDHSSTTAPSRSG